MNSDNVNHPEHYQTTNGLEAIDVIEAFTADLQGIEAVCTGNVLKYMCRWKKKNGLEDLKKARWYLEKLIGYYYQEEVPAGIRITNGFTGEVIQDYETE